VWLAGEVPAAEAHFVRPHAGGLRTVRCVRLIIALTGNLCASFAIGTCHRSTVLEPPAQVVAAFTAAMASRDTSAVRRIAASDSVAATYMARPDFGGGRWASVPTARLVSPDIVFDRGDTLVLRYQTGQRQRCGSADGPDDYIDVVLLRRGAAYRMVFIQLGPPIC
jgi:hypothetical protein